MAACKYREVIKNLTQHEYAKLIKPSELAKWIRDAGLEMLEMTGMTYNPISKQYRLTTDDVSVNYLIRARKP